jgi:hypothetical protein
MNNISEKQNRCRQTIDKRSGKKEKEREKKPDIERGDKIGRSRNVFCLQRHRTLVEKTSSVERIL